MTEREQMVAEAFGANTSAEARRYAASPDEEEIVLSRLFHPEVQFESRLASVEGANAYRGYDGLRAYRDDMFDAWDDWWQEDVQCHELADGRVLSLSRWRSRGKGSGVELDIAISGIWEFRDGKIYRMALHNSREQALAAAGLTEHDL